MAENAYLDDGGLQQVVAWLREKDVGEHQEGYYTSEICNDYENNIALGPYNHIEGGNNIIADTTDKYYAYAGNPFLDIPSDIKLINLVENSNNYHINSEQGIFSLENIELPEFFTVNKEDTPVLQFSTKSAKILCPCCGCKNPTYPYCRECGQKIDGVL